MHGWMDGWVGGWINGCMDGWMHGWMDEGFIPFRCNPLHSFIHYLVLPIISFQLIPFIPFHTIQDGMEWNQ